jgi:hypothetical protein
MVKPTKESLKKQESRISSRLLLIEQGFESWKKKAHDIPEGERDISRYHKIMGYNLLKNQLKTLNYILNE